MAMPLRVLLFGTLFLACSFSTADGLPTLVTFPSGQCRWWRLPSWQTPLTSGSVPASTHAAFISGSSIILPAISATTTQTAGSSLIGSIVEDNRFSAKSTIPRSTTLLKGGSTSVAVKTVKPTQETPPASIVANSTSRRQLTTAPTASSTSPASVVRVNVRQVVGFFVFLLRTHRALSPRPHALIGSPIVALCYISAISVKRAAAARRGGASRPGATMRCRLRALAV
jgi:hypothetical protein